MARKQVTLTRSDVDAGTPLLQVEDLRTHFLTEGLLDALDTCEPGHSALMGYIMDGFGIYGPRGEDGKILTSADLDPCHGHTHPVLWDGKMVNMYHYHWTYDFPYNVGCFKGVPVKPWN